MQCRDLVLAVVAVVIVGLGLWRTAWPYHLFAILPLAVTRVVLTAGNDDRPGAYKAGSERSRREADGGRAVTAQAL